jgi:hypothetical protein
MQEIEGVVDKENAALAVGRHLGVSKTRQSGVVDASEFAVDVGGLRLQIGEHRDDARIFVSPVQPVRVTSCARP